MSQTFRLLAFAVSMAGFATSLSAQGTEDKYGFVSRRGQVIPAVYASTGEFSDGMARASMKSGGLYGYIDKTGKMVIPQRFKTAGPFMNGIAYVIDEDGKSLIIDKRGKTVRELKDMQPSLPETHDSVGLVRFFSDGKWGYMTPRGDVVLSGLAYDRVDFFYEGLAAVKASGGKIGFIDTTGKEVIAPQFYSGTYLSSDVGNPPQFHHGLAPVAVDSAATKIGYVNHAGTMVIKPAFTDAGYFSSGVAPVRTEASHDLYGYIDTTGKTVIDFKYTYAWNFSEGTGNVEYRDSLVSKWGPKGTAVIDSTGAVVLKVTDARFGASMSEGVIDFKTGQDLHGFIDINGEVTVPPQFASLWRMHDGMAKMRMEVRRVSDLPLSGTHYIYYDISQNPVSRLGGGNSYYLYYAHVYGPKGLSASDIAEAVTVKPRHPIMNISKGTGSFEYNGEEIRKNHSSVSDEALKKAGILYGAYAPHQVGTMGARNTDSVFGENLGTFEAKKP